METFIRQYSLTGDDIKILDLIVEDFESRKPIWKKSDSTRNYWSVPSSLMNSHLMEAYLSKIEAFIALYKRDFSKIFDQLDLMKVDPVWNCQKYEKGNSYSKWHCENLGIRYGNRCLAFMTYLNDCYSGGETEFLYQEKTFLARKGITLIWPAHFTHVHRGIPSDSGEKYILTGWVNFLDSKNIIDSIQSEDSLEEFFIKLDTISKS